MTTTPTPESTELERDRRAAKRLVDSVHLNLAPWQFEHLVDALTVARRHGYREGVRDSDGRARRAIASQLVDLAVRIGGEQ